MATIGNKFIGFAKLTITDATDGTSSEAVSAGVITTHARSFSAVNGTSNTPIFAGDREEDSINDPTGTLKVELSQDDYENRAMVSGHAYDSETNSITELETDTAPYIRVCSCATVRKDKATSYELEKIWKGRLAAPDAEHQTKEKSVSAKYISMSGEYMANCDGKRRTVESYATYAAALAAAKEFLNITTVV